MILAGMVGVYSRTEPTGWEDAEIFARDWGVCFNVGWDMRSLL